MASEKQHPGLDPVETMLLAKMADLKAALESYRKSKGVEGSSGGLDGFAPVGDRRPMDLPVGIFRDKGVQEAIVLYLEAGRRKQTNKEITNGLLKGGIATTSANFEATVATALIRLRREGIVLRFPEGWDLAASYPESLRTRLEKDTKKPSTPAKKRNRTTKKAARSQPKPKNRTKAPKAAKAAATVELPAVPIAQRITEYLQGRGTSFTTTQEIASQLKTGEAFMRLTLGKMAKKGIIEKDADGRVRLVKKAA